MIEPFRRGYEVMSDSFYVINKIVLYRDGNPLLDEEGNPFIRYAEKVFDDFNEYYEYLDADIYTNACYLGWNPNPSLIKKYHIKKEKLSEISLFSDTIENHSWKVENDIEALRRERAARGKLLKSLYGRLAKCRNPLDIQKTLNYFSKKELDSYSSSFGIVLSMFFASRENAESLFYESFRQKRVPDSFAEGIIPYCENPIKMAEAYESDKYSPSTVRRHKKHLLSAARAFMDLDNSIVDTAAYGDESGLFVIKTVIQSDDRERHIRYRVFTDFYEFAKALNNDLRGVDLSKSFLEGVDYSKYLINSETTLPLSESGVITYCLEKGFSKGTLFVKHYWKDEKGTTRYSERFTFKHFADYVQFLAGNLCNSDFHMMSSEVYSRIRKTHINFDGIIEPEAFNELETHIEFERTLENETLTQEVLQLVRPKEVGLETVDALGSSYENSGNKILYLSDLHLDQIVAAEKCKTIGDVYKVIQDIGRKLSTSYAEYVDFFGDGNVVVILAGDITHSPRLFKMFTEMGYQFLKKAVIILGNHELWGYPGLSVEDIVARYSALSPVPIVQNTIILFEDDMVGKDTSTRYVRYRPRTISYDEAMRMSADELAGQMLSSRVIILAGIGFSGLNEEFNAEDGIYLETLTHEQEINESTKFETLYNHFIAATRAVKDRVLVVATHMPLENWNHRKEYVDGVVYISGHTHRNYFHDDGAIRIYADNQNGYHGRHPVFKCIYNDDSYSPFESYADGIYEITKAEYIRFYNAKKMRMHFGMDYQTIYMLKKNDYYCFLARLKSGKLSILNGGSSKALKAKEPAFYFQRMDKIIEAITQPLKQYTAIQKKVSELVQSFGGDGQIHGCIVDIDFFNHIYINPVDLTVKGYYATDIIHKWIYDSIPALLEDHSPELYKNYLNLLETTADKDLMYMIPGQASTMAAGIEYLETDIYRASREIRKMQRLFSNVLSYWNEDLLEEKDRYVEPPRIVKKKSIPVPKKIRPVKEPAEPKEKRADKLKKKYLGMTRLMNCGLSATVIEYEDCKNVTIQFEDGLVKTKVRSDHFMNGNVSHSE